MMETNAARVELKAAWGGDVEVSVAVLDRHISVDLGAEVVCEVLHQLFLRNLNVVVTSNPPLFKA
jgi:hypothetical protein